MCYYIYNKVSYSNFLDTCPSLVDSLAEMVMGEVRLTANAAGRVKLVVLTLLSCKISSNIYNYNTCFIIPYTIIVS